MKRPAVIDLASESDEDVVDVTKRAKSSPAVVDLVSDEEEEERPAAVRAPMSVFPFPVKSSMSFIDDFVQRQREEERAAVPAPMSVFPFPVKSSMSFIDDFVQRQREEEKPRIPSTQDTKKELKALYRTLPDYRDDKWTDAFRRAFHNRKECYYLPKSKGKTQFVVEIPRVVFSEPVSAAVVDSYLTYVHGRVTSSKEAREAIAVAAVADFDGSGPTEYISDVTQVFLAPVLHADSQTWSLVVMNNVQALFCGASSAGTAPQLYYFDPVRGPPESLKEDVAWLMARKFASQEKQTDAYKMDAYRRLLLKDMPEPVHVLPKQDAPDGSARSNAVWMLMAAYNVIRAKDDSKLKSDPSQWPWHFSALAPFERNIVQLYDELRSAHPSERDVVFSGNTKAIPFSTQHRTEKATIKHAEPEELPVAEVPMAEEVVEAEPTDEFPEQTAYLLAHANDPFVLWQPDFPRDASLVVDIPTAKMDEMLSLPITDENLQTLSLKMLGYDLKNTLDSFFCTQCWRATSSDHLIACDTEDCEMSSCLQCAFGVTDVPADLESRAYACRFCKKREPSPSILFARHKFIKKVFELEGAKNAIKHNLAQFNAFDTYAAVAVREAAEAENDLAGVFQKIKPFVSQIRLRAENVARMTPEQWSNITRGAKAEKDFVEVLKNWKRQESAREELGFEDHLSRFLSESQWWSKDDVKQAQDALLRKVVRETLSDIIEAVREGDYALPPGVTYADIERILLNSEDVRGDLEQLMPDEDEFVEFIVDQGLPEGVAEELQTILTPEKYEWWVSAMEVLATLPDPDDDATALLRNTLERFGADADFMRKWLSEVDVEAWKRLNMSPLQRLKETASEIKSLHISDLAEELLIHPTLSKLLHTALEHIEAGAVVPADSTHAKRFLASLTSSIQESAMSADTSARAERVKSLLESLVAILGEL